MQYFNTECNLFVLLLINFKIHAGCWQNYWRSMVRDFITLIICHTHCYLFSHINSTPLYNVFGNIWICFLVQNIAVNWKKLFLRGKISTVLCIMFYIYCKYLKFEYIFKRVHLHTFPFTKTFVWKILETCLSF